VYKLSNAATSFTQISTSWARRYCYESAGITITGAALADICTVSPATRLLKGANTPHNMYCYVSAANTVKVVVTIGDVAITQGSSDTQLSNAFRVSFAVIRSY
jgi:hypothetical protein